MRRYLLKIIIVLSISLLFQLSIHAEIVWDIQQEIKLDKKPVDTAVSEEGTYTFILTNDGIVHIFNSSGNLLDQINVGKRIDGIACGKDKNTLILKSKKDKTVKNIEFEFVQDINIEGAPFKGRADAPVTIVVFTDYQCSYCSKLSKLVNQVFEKNKNDVKLVIKNFPLPMHSYARQAAEAAVVAHSKGKFWEMHNDLYKNMSRLNDKVVKKIVTGYGLDPDEFLKEMGSQKIRKIVSQDFNDGEKAGVMGTPTVYINGIKLKRRSLKEFQNKIDAEILKTK